MVESEKTLMAIEEREKWRRREKEIIEELNEIKKKKKKINNRLKELKDTIKDCKEAIRIKKKEDLPSPMEDMSGQIR